MAKKTALNLKDLISRQRELAAAGDGNAIKQLARLEELANETRSQTAILQDIRAIQPTPKIVADTQKLLKQDRILQTVQALEAHKADKDDDRIADASESVSEITKKGLLDKTGDGLNANVIKLLKVMGGATAGIAPQRSSEPVDRPKNTGQQRTAVAGRLGGQAAVGRLGAIGFAKENIKKLGTLAGWFDTSDGKSQGLLGQAVIRAQEKSDFIKDQIATGATTNKGLAAKRFDKVNDLRVQGSRLLGETQAMRDRGLSEDQIARTGIFDKQKAVDDKIAIANPLARETRLAEQQDQAPAQPTRTPPTKDSKDSSLGAPAGPSGTSEQTAENLRMMADQNETLKQIEENTRGLASPAGVSKTPPAQESGSGGLLGAITGMFGGGGLLRRGGAILSRAGTGIVSAGRAIASGAANLATRAAPILTQVGESAASGAANLATKAAPVATQAGGVLSKAGGLAKGILGKAALPLAAGMAVYDGVTGYKDAAENLGIEGREATTGEKASSAAGSIVSGLTFGLLDKKSASKGIASFFGAGTGVSTRADQPAQNTPMTLEEINAAKESLRRGNSTNMATDVSAPTPQSADTVYNKSSENAAAAQQPASQAPVVINAPTTNSVQQTQNYAPKSPPRNTESSLQQYNRAKYAF
jgi:hypothetical protein